jgi:hypothetical protein
MSLGLKELDAGARAISTRYLSNSIQEHPKRSARAKPASDFPAPLTPPRMNIRTDLTIDRAVALPPPLIVRDNNDPAMGK